jgi:uncharacterized repeat protein (TIGR01451 family)
VPTGTTIGFTITVSNSNLSGTAIATNVTLNDPLPAGTGLNWSITPAYGGPGTCTISAQILSCAFGDMAPGDQALVHVQSPTNPPPGSSGGAYTNIAIASADNEQPVPSLAATIVVTAPQVPNVTVLKTADASPVATGMPISFTITVNNSNAVGTGTAFNVVLNDSFPAGPGLNWAINPGYGGPGTCAIANQVLTCTLGNLAPGDKAVVHVQSPTTPPPGSSASTYTNIAAVTADNQQLVFPSIASVVVSPPPAPNLSVVKTADATPVPTGMPIAFTITVSNSNAAGTGTAFNVMLNDPLPAGPGLNWSIPAYGGPGTCTIASQVLSCTFGNLPPGAQAVVHVQSPTNVAPGSSAGGYTNVATVTADNQLGLLTSTASIVVNPPAPPNLSVTKTADATPVATGKPIGFTIIVSNSNAAGTGIAANVMLNDTLPPGPGLNWSIPNYGGPGTCAIALQVLNCAFGNLAPGAQATVHVQSPTTPPPGSSAGTYTDTASVTAGNSQPLFPASASIVVNPPAPAVIKSFGAATIQLKGSTSLGFVVTNPNQFGATGISFSDTLPAGLVISTPNGFSTTCTGSVIAAAGTSIINFSGGFLAGGGSCAFFVNVTAIAGGIQNNTTGPISSNESGAGATSNTASLTVIAPPTITKAFADAEIQLFGLDKTTLTFTLTNPNSIPLTGLAFIDTLPPGLIVSVPNGMTNSCGGEFTQIAVANSFGLSGATLAPGASCTLSVDVTGIVIGVWTNFSSELTSNEAAQGAPASASTSVDTLFFRWFSLE